MAREQFDLQSSAGLVRLGSHVLAASYNTLATEKLRNTRSMQYGMKTCWTLMLIEFSDMVGHTIPTNSRRYYTAEEIRNADQVCTIFVALPYTRPTKKTTLVKARVNPPWRELSPIFGIPGTSVVAKSRRSCCIYVRRQVCVPTRRRRGR